MLQERLYVIEKTDGIWRLRLDPLDRYMSVHQSEEAALKVAMATVRKQAPCRIQVRHSGLPVSEWHIRYTDAPWVDVPTSPLQRGQRTVSSRSPSASV